MPNWAENSLVVKGDNQELQRFDEDFENFESLVPLQGEWEYDKAIATWGTKWDIDRNNVNLSIIDGNHHYYFNTAWTPPENFVRKVSKKYNLTFVLKTAEMGVCYMNETKFENGMEIGEKYAESLEEMERKFSGDEFFDQFLNENSFHPEY